MELTSRKADWQLLAIGNTGYAFTNPKARSVENEMYYKESADKRAWNAMTGFFAEVFRK